MDFKEQVKNGFSACKDDISTLFDENIELKKTLSSLSNQNLELKSEMNDIKSMLVNLTKQITELQSEPKQQVQTLPSQTSSPKAPISNKDPYEALLAFKAKVNKRDMLKQKMMSMVTENGMQLSELKFMFVDHFRYCSKATFYNYLKELELEKTIVIQREHTKNVVYLPGLRKHI